MNTVSRVLLYLAVHHEPTGVLHCCKKEKGSCGVERDGT